MKELKDYLHLYLGCECYVEHIGYRKKTILLSCHTNGNCQVAHANGRQDFWLAKYIKLILRPLRDMTEEEGKEFEKLNLKLGQTVLYFQKDAELTRWLLSKHFDLFGLIEADLAIDKTKIAEPA